VKIKYSNRANGESRISDLGSVDLVDWTEFGNASKGVDGGKWDADTNPAPLHVGFGSAAVIPRYRGCPFNCNGTEWISFASADTFAGPYNAH
jgi:hypothetical protein